MGNMCYITTGVGALPPLPTVVQNLAKYEELLQALNCQTIIKHTCNIALSHASQIFKFLRLE